MEAMHELDGFNLRREASPLATSQERELAHADRLVSISDEKPAPLRRFTPMPSSTLHYLFQSQTRSQPPCDTASEQASDDIDRSFNLRREASPLATKGPCS